MHEIESLCLLLLLTESNHCLIMSVNQQHIQAMLDLASASDIAEGKQWYATANSFARELANRYDISHNVCAGVIAALSPRNKWDRNCLDAENLISVYVNAGASACDDVKVCTFGKNKAKAIAILDHAFDATVSVDVVTRILSGPKLREFFSCIIGLDDVCIDGHAYSIWFGDRVTLANVPSIGVKLRRAIKSDYLTVADNNDLKGYELQAITWVTHRRIHNI